MEIVTRSHTGLLRRRNEDFVAGDEDLGVAVLADGMGGLHDGDVASRMAVEAVLEHVRDITAPQRDAFSADVLKAAVDVANDRLRRHARSTLMGTTLLVASVGAARVRLAHVGDSRAYHWHRGHFEQLTRDHSLVQEMVDEGLLQPDEVRFAPNRNVVTRAVGLEPAVTADTLEVTFAAGDLLLLCSDGLWEMLEDHHTAAMLEACSGGRIELEQCADALVDAANSAGGHDNVSVVLIRG